MRLTGKKRHCCLYCTNHAIHDGPSLICELVKGVLALLRARHAFTSVCSCLCSGRDAALQQTEKAGSRIEPTLLMNAGQEVMRMKVTRRARQCAHWDDVHMLRHGSRAPGPFQAFKLIGLTQEHSQRACPVWGTFPSLTCTPCSDQATHFLLQLPVPKPPLRPRGMDARLVCTLRERWTGFVQLLILMPP